MLIHELSKKTGISIHTIRFYENKGLIQGATDKTKTSNNYKHYDELVIEKLDIILEAKEVGFTLTEIKKLLESWYGGGNNSRAEQISMFKSKIEEIDKKTKQLKQIKKRLEIVVEGLEKNKSC